MLLLFGVLIALICCTISLWFVYLWLRFALSGFVFNCFVDWFVVCMVRC